MLGIGFLLDCARARCLQDVWQDADEVCDHNSNLFIQELDSVLTVEQYLIRFRQHFDNIFDQQKLLILPVEIHHVIRRNKLIKTRLSMTPLKT